uniref:Uncharacterized protein n=1 Tax=Micrurus surinamensis TaxID=129470 RepID=A0A2D4P6M8_MICSU
MMDESVLILVQACSANTFLWLNRSSAHTKGLPFLKPLPLLLCQVNTCISEQEDGFNHHLLKYQSKDCLEVLLFPCICRIYLSVTSIKHARCKAVLPLSVFMGSMVVFIQISR